MRRNKISLQQLGSLVEDFTQDKKTKLGYGMKRQEELFQEQEEKLKGLIIKKERESGHSEDDGNMMNHYRRKKSEAETADQERKVKERKVLLGQKRVPRTINLLTWMIRGVFFVILCLSGIGLDSKNKLRNYMESGELAIQHLGMKEADIPDIAYTSWML